MSDVVSRLPRNPSGGFEAAALLPVLDILPYAVLLFADEKIVAANPSAADLLRAGHPSKLRGLHMADLLHPAFPEACMPVLGEITAYKRDHSEVEEIYFRRDGTTVDVETASTSLIYDGVPAIMVLARDITERKRIAWELRKHEAQLRQALTIAQLGTWTYDPREDLLTLSPECARILGSNQETLGGLSTEGYIRLFVHPEDQRRVSEAFAASANYQKTSDLEYRIVRADGAVRIVHDRGEMMFDSADEPKMEIGFLQDVTEQQREALELRAREAQLRHAQRIAKIGVWSLNHKSGALFLSPEFADILGIDHQELDNISLEGYCERFIHPDDKQKVAAAYAATENTTFYVNLEYRVLRPDGRVCHVREVGEAVRDASGRVVAEVGILQDITEMKT